MTHTFLIVPIFFYTLLIADVEAFTLVNLAMFRRTDYRIVLPLIPGFKISVWGKKKPDGLTEPRKVNPTKRLYKANMVNQKKYSKDPKK